MGMPMLDEKAFTEWNKRLKCIQAEKKRLMDEGGLDELNAWARATKKFSAHERKV